MSMNEMNPSGRVDEVTVSHRTDCDGAGGKDLWNG